MQDNYFSQIHFFTAYLLLLVEELLPEEDEEFLLEEGTPPLLLELRDDETLPLRDDEEELQLTHEEDDVATDERAGATERVLCVLDEELRDDVVAELPLRTGEEERVDVVV